MRLLGTLASKSEVAGLASKSDVAGLSDVLERHTRALTNLEAFSANLAQASSDDHECLFGIFPCKLLGDRFFSWSRLKFYCCNLSPNCGHGRQPRMRWNSGPRLHAPAQGGS